MMVVVVVVVIATVVVRDLGELVEIIERLT